MGGTILVVGLLQHDSGKTTTTVEVMRHLRDRGFDVGYIKPIAAFNAWNDYTVLTKSVEYGFPVSGDALKVKSTFSLPEGVEEINPICTVMSPLDPEKVGWNILSVESVSSQLAALRITDRDGNVRVYEIEPEWGRFPDFFEEVWSEIRKKAGTEHIEYTEFERIVEKSRTYCDYWMRRIVEWHDAVIIESSSNVSAPSCSSLDVDAVIAVTPGKAFIVDGERYAKAIEVAGYLGDPWKITTPAVLELVKPEKSFSIHPKKMSVDLLNAVENIVTG
ncbi:hypothetical protein [Geoglobus sp.]